MRGVNIFEERFKDIKKEEKKENFDLTDCPKCGSKTEIPDTHYSRDCYNFEKNGINTLKVCEKCGHMIQTEGDYNNYEEMFGIAS